MLDNWLLRYQTIYIFGDIEVFRLKQFGCQFNFDLSTKRKQGEQYETIDIFCHTANHPQHLLGADPGPRGVRGQVRGPGKRPVTMSKVLCSGIKPARVCFSQWTG